MGLMIEVQGVPGTPIWEMATEACRLSELLGVMVNFNFNGCRLTAFNHNEAAIEADYDRWRFDASRPDGDADPATEAANG